MTSSSSTETLAISVTAIDAGLLEDVIGLYNQCTGSSHQLRPDQIRQHIAAIAGRIRAIRVWELPSNSASPDGATLIVRPAEGGRDFAAFGISVHYDDDHFGPPDAHQIQRRFQDGLRPLLAKHDLIAPDQANARP